ncbi:MAG: hypothetical protein DKM50_01690 [Candidatus Margulisiibacteriota bacterium]|nr:MAG: hypothetical protein A2X43_13455 [Candidatus Margulisbacteria bacterium GWD2_39_127]OGI04736.1 MAG: hypothetical protein A2X42_10540 [Candidatus Margulisbacteria bacterium GWF2_38_17]OGI05681.1 MAG: hypothetical protein A2X41_03125 [Candidatus Margulisbacteria bacterium GWE2_39_32]PZM83615.1 MAG: hypothetical protein DKM50_01690 [Candidatus Margulisiibacteriota bacterium]HAR62033.1 hypothetical protein [Candidatus Margulisiibacteriota bacterium]
MEKYIVVSLITFLTATTLIYGIYIPFSNHSQPKKAKIINEKILPEEKSSENNTEEFESPVSQDNQEILLVKYQLTNKDIGQFNHQYNIYLNK